MDAHPRMQSDIFECMRMFFTAVIYSLCRAVGRSENPNAVGIACQKFTVVAPVQAAHDISFPSLTFFNVISSELRY